MISGLMPMDAGQVLYDGNTIADTRISYVFQNYRDALFPWLRAIDNIHYPLRLLGLPRREREQRVERLLADFEVKIDLHAYPYKLSGGQQQTVSILRALVTDPEVLSPRGAVLGSRLRNDAVQARAAAEDLHEDADHAAARLARSRGGRAARRPRAAADPPADARGRFHHHRPAVAAQHRGRHR